MTDTWWKRLSYPVMSLIVAWHTLAMFVAPMPDNSTALRWFRSFMNPYLHLLKLDNQWSFFAPNVGKQFQFRYIVEDAAGVEHQFVPLNEPSWSLPKYVRWREFKYLYDGVLDDPESRVQVVPQLCKKHASLKPVAVSFVLVEELDFWPEDFRKGHRPLDPDFVRVSRLTNTSC